MSHFTDRLLPSPDFPLGAHWDGRGVNFAVFSEAAEKVELCLFDGGRRELARLVMPECTNGVWHGYLPTVGPGLLYGYRAYGPYQPKHGQRFNPHKLLLDPYARQLAGELRWHDALYGYRIGSARADLSFDRRDSAAYMPKGVVVADRFDWGNDHAPRVPWSETVIYEAHVRGISALRDDLPAHDRGTFGALGHPSTIAYLQKLGITAIELMPVHAFARDRHLLERGLTNYWGYNTLSFFAPEPSYLSDGTLGQLKWAVKQLHAAGIEVILDVVYNHTCEGGELGPTLSLRGFGNPIYYRTTEDPRYLLNDTGCGNTVNFTHARVIQLAMDSLRYWVQEFHVDGFRFDLGVTLGREVHGFDPGAGFFDALLQDPVLAPVKFISEPWDIGMGGYQVGNHPARFGEWNGRYRDDVRRYWKGDAGLRGALAARLQGSADIFDRQRRRPWASINFVTAHDGFTLHDLVSYNDKHNEANVEQNGDGSDQNDSYNWGVEGPSDDPAVDAQREQMKRNFLATNLFSLGTPMFLAGDEFGHTQGGNNNAYCQDNAISWLDWTQLQSERGGKLLAFTRRLIALRGKYPLLRANYFQHARFELAPGLRDVFWFDERGCELQAGDWHNASARLLGLRRAQVIDEVQAQYERPVSAMASAVILLLNSDCAAHEFQLPEPHFDYSLLIDTHRPELCEEPVRTRSITVAAHSFIALAGNIAIQEIEQSHLYAGSAEASVRNDEVDEAPANDTVLDIDEDTIEEGEPV
ncbi:MAG TPA: glycogen debranching protein GlgX [Spongiibacteraceae bacterium]|nr:glycogen debranching protein GlgX [Spongiibacteraceae bacterium]